MRKKRSWIGLVLCLSMLFGCAAQQATPVTQAAAGCKNLLGVKKALLNDETAFPAGRSPYDWIAMGFALAGIGEKYEDYLAALERHVTACYQEKGTLDERKPTEFHRIAMTVLALGGDPTRFGKNIDGADVNLIADGVYNYGGDLGAQGLNGLIFGLMALDAGQFAVPEDARYTREQILERILSEQEPDGGFGLVPGTSDTDITAMALQALAPYQEQAEPQIDAALKYLAGEMTENCTFLTYGSETVETGCQVVIALCALGIDPESDPRFSRGEQNLLTGIGGFSCDDGSYRHLKKDKTGDLLSTEQAMLALIAVERMHQGRRLYDFTDRGAAAGN